MIACETALLTLLTFTLIGSSISDVRTGLVYNKLLFMTTIVAVSINIPYHLIWCDAFLPLFIINFVVIALISIVLYACHYWAAGDSKLLIAATLCIPSRFLTFWDIGVCPSITVVAFAFIIATLYTIAESIYFDAKAKVAAPFESVSIDPLTFIASYAFVSGVVALVNLLVIAFAASIMEFNLSLLSSFSFMLTLILIQIREQLGLKQMLIIGLIAWSLRIILGFALSQPFTFHLELWSITLVLVGLFVISYAGRYNYETIPTSSVKAGQILSLTTVLSFSPSRIKGLPRATTEDMRSRITEEEAESIRRWEKSKYGQPTILIVKKVPFALFISLGTMFFIGMEVLMQCW